MVFSQGYGDEKENLLTVKPEALSEQDVCTQERCVK